MEAQVRMGLAALTRLAFEGVDLQPLKQQLLMEHFQDSQNAGALMDLAMLDQLNGHLEAGLEWQLKALTKARFFYTHKKRMGKKTALILAAPIHMGGNTPVEFLLERSDFEIVTHYVVPGMPIEPMPPHDVVFIAAPGDCSVTRPFLRAIEALTANWLGRVNLPEHIIKLERDVLPDLFSPTEPVRCPRTRRYDRSTLEKMVDRGITGALAHDLGPFPLIIRPEGSHAGRGLERLDYPEALEIYLNYTEGEEFFLSEFVDYATPADGMFRKYRIIFVDGKPFPCHMAICDQWKVWYMNAGMQGSAEKRREEAAFMANFDTDFARRHAAAFDLLCRRVGLDYFGIDCAEDGEGRLVVFEGDNALIVHDMDPSDVFPYKAAPMQRLYAAFEQMLLDRCIPPAQKSNRAPAGREVVRSV